MAGTDASKLVARVLEGDRRALAQAITLIESNRADDRDSSRILLEHLVPHSGKSFRVGISGVPGVGKSTLLPRSAAVPYWVTKRGWSAFPNAMRHSFALLRRAAHWVASHGAHAKAC